ncbi:MAG: hypothetical protein ACHQD9_09080, partial [Chitinophagales bacterium]
MFLLFFAFHFPSFSQSLNTKLWDLDFGGNKNDSLIVVESTADGGYILGGYTNSSMNGDVSQTNEGGEDFWILKLDASGIKQWDRLFGGSGDDRLDALVQTSDGSYLLGGYSVSGKGGDKSQYSKGGSDYWIIKIDATGNKLWDYDYGGSDQDYLTSIIPTLDGGFLIGGYSDSGISGDRTVSSQGADDYWIVKIDFNGIKQWDNRFGGNADDRLYTMLQNADGTYMLCGLSHSGPSGDVSQISHGSKDYWLVKTDVN